VGSRVSTRGIVEVARREQRCKKGKDKSRISREVCDNFESCIVKKNSGVLSCTEELWVGRHEIN
jgi:hypothetical protein